MVRVKFVRGHVALRQQFKELQVRSQKVKATANVFVENQLEELFQKDVIVQLLPKHGHNVREDFRRHIEARVDAEYPATLHGTHDGAIPEQIQKAMQEA